MAGRGHAREFALIEEEDNMKDKVDILRISYNDQFKLKRKSRFSLGRK
jgi:hypothetical protein